MRRYFGTQRFPEIKLKLRRSEQLSCKTEGLGRLINFPEENRVRVSIKKEKWGSPKKKPLRRKKRERKKW